MANAFRASKTAIKRAGRRGFTFVEILATLTLLAIVLPVVMTGISLSLSVASLAKQQAQASSLAHAKLMELAVEGQWQQASLSGDFGEDWPEYRWTAQVSDWDGGVLEQLDVTVWWRYRGAERSGTLSTLVYTGVNTATNTEENQ